MTEKTNEMPYKKNGGPAFPFSFEHAEGHPRFRQSVGMSLRDWFAGKVLNGMIQNDAEGLAKAICDGKGSLVLENTARLSYAIADAMLKERER